MHVVVRWYGRASFTFFFGQLICYLVWILLSAQLSLRCLFVIPLKREVDFILSNWVVVCYKLVFKFTGFDAFECVLETVSRQPSVPRI